VIYDMETVDYELNCNTLSPNVRVNGTCNFFANGDLCSFVI